MAEEQSRKELLETPDPFMVFVGRALEFAKKYQIQITIAAGALVIMFIAISGFIYFQQRAEDQASLLLGKALTKFKMIQQTDASFVEYEDAKKRFKDIVDKYGSTGAGKAALLHYSDLCYTTKNFDEAIKRYSEALDAFAGDPEFKSLILNGLAYSHESNGDNEKAAEYFEMIVSDESSAMVDQALFNLGRIYGQLGDAKLQKEMYNRIVAQYPDSMFFEFAKEKISG